MKWFLGCKTIFEVKQRYRQLALQHHPDRGGVTAVMQEINAEYLVACKMSDGQRSKGNDNREHVYRYNQKEEEGVMEHVASAIKIHMVDATVEIIGVYVWLTGENLCYYSKQLSEAGFHYHDLRTKQERERLNNPKLWVWYWGAYHRPYNPHTSLDGLRQNYGSTVMVDNATPFDQVGA